MKCINTIGSFQCIPRVKCTEGLRLNNEETRCIGVCNHFENVVVDQCIVLTEYFLDVYFIIITLDLQTLMNVLNSLEFVITSVQTYGDHLGATVGRDSVYIKITGVILFVDKCIFLKG